MVLCLGVLSGMFVTTERVQATLGEPAASIESDRMALSAVRRPITVRKSYSVQEIVSDSIAVRQYVSSSGIVFGITWNGLVHPDLTPLLGSYAAEYQEALKQTQRKLGQRRLQVKANRIVVEKWGRMRNLQGRAYAPALVPTEVNLDEIR
jgi:curli biogenesis system outer membrane secretion channel CsgG